jgi:hypothetical protein
MSSKWPTHDDRSEVMAKVVIIGRTYSSGIERHAGEAGLNGVVEELVGQREWLDRKLAELRREGDVPREDLVDELSKVHGRVLGAIQKRTRDGNKPRSFVSKYLHFHAPCFPIIDSLASQQINSRGWAELQSKSKTGQEVPTEADPDYWKFCIRVSRLGAMWAQKNAHHPATARNIDTLLLEEHRFSRSKPEAHDAPDHQLPAR